MANFIIVFDPDPERRSQFTKTVEPLLPIVDGLITNSCTTGNLWAGWAAHQNAPVSWVSDAQGAGFIWGDAIPPHKSSPIDPRKLRILWQNAADSNLPAFDGFYAAVTYHPDFGLTVGADYLGLFPVYYYISGDVALVASTPELFKHHPLFRQAFNPAGLVGILLTNGLFNGQTLWQNVQRLAAGHVLVWKPATFPREIQQHQLLGNQSSQLNSLTFAEHLDILDQALDQAITRQVRKEEPCGLLLSGGLDSRMLAGFLGREGIKPIALSLGNRSDLEIECALGVVKQLGLEHRLAAISLDDYPAYADLLIKGEHLANGFNWVMNWSLAAHLSSLAPKVINGYLLDLVLGGKIPYALSQDNLSFETFFFQGVNRWGLSPDLLERLLRQEVFGELVQDTLAQIRAVYESYSDIEFRKAWYFEIYHRQRFHVGSAAWQLSFAAWPIMPTLDQQLLEITAALPVKTIAKRKAQNQLLCTRFPQLAQLPLDRNAFNVEPLLSSKNRQRFARFWRWQRKFRQWQQKLGYERRYYYRIYDLNNIGWRAIRQQAEPYREQVQHLLHLEVLNTLLPTPDQPWQYSLDSITEASGVKALLGLLLWSRDNL
ncbi:asparagine synthase-related protein [Lyngbya aestuarii]|uniref:asparagine synthase-related protein n=1 Tax=Lyngbya aestuarii TaxID=118322 RepID=UPI00403E2BD7